MKPLTIFAPLYLTLLLCAAAACAAQTGAKRAGNTRAPVGLKCPEGEAGQPRPEVLKLHLGDITKKALKFPRPSYAGAAKGRVRAEVVINPTTGEVVWARTLSGDPGLRDAVESVICGVRFRHGFIDGRVMLLRGTVTYRFAGP